MRLDDKTAVALEDLGSGFLNIRIPFKLGWVDLVARYRRTKLGPFWIVLSTGMTILGVGAVWSAILGIKISEFFPYLTAGFIIWHFIASAMIEGAVVFTSQAHIIRSVSLPLTFHVLRLSIRNIFNFLHNMLIFAVVAFVFDVPVTWWLLALIPALIFALLNQLWVGILLGLLGARYRDIPALIGAVMTVIFLLTPVMWTPDMLGDRRNFVDFNPIAQFLEILRAPLLGQAPDPKAWAIVVGVTITGLVVSFLVLRVWRNRLVFWL
jgi:ABC-type polysaccharide/polyol phosphate export permease